MVRRTLTSLVAGLIAASVVLAVPRGQSRSDARIEGYAYYLFLAERPVSCEDCYVPLLVTSKRLDDVAKERGDQQCVVITTYERDSIVGVPRGVAVSAADVKPPERHMRVRNRPYRYQEVSASEVLGLLEHARGTIPISRIPEMRVPSADELADLIARFRTVK